MTRTYAVTGSASGIGAATQRLLTERGHRVIGVDLRDAEVVADLGTPTGRAEAVAAITEASRGQLDAVIACAGVAGGTTGCVSVNYFGAVEVLTGLRPLLAAATAPRAVVISSVASLLEVNPELVDTLLAFDEATALKIAEGMLVDDPEDRVGTIYASAKRALSRWVRRAAITPDWAGAQIALNAIAPGVVITPMTEAMRNAPGGIEAMDKAAPMPLNHHQQPEVIAALANWLTSADNSHLCGQTLYCDGGIDASLRGDDIWTGLVPADMGL